MTYTSYKSNRTYPLFDGVTNMALDAGLLDDADREGRPGFRVYGWEGPWISLGMNQDPERDLLDPELVPWVMRPTGGQGVLHGHDVTVAIAVPLGLVAGSSRLAVGSREGKSGRSVRVVYRWLTEPIVQALRECGLPAILAESRGLPSPKSEIQYPKSPDCFTAVSPNDIVHERLGAKVCGCALRVARSSALLQASIPAGPPLVDPRRVFARPSQIPSVPWDSEAFSEAFERAMMLALRQSAFPS